MQCSGDSPGIKVYQYGWVANSTESNLGRETVGVVLEIMTIPIADQWYHINL